MALFGIRKLVNTFRRDERGEITVAWLVITAAIVGLTVSLMMRIGDGTQELSNKVDTEMSGREISTAY